MGRWPAVLLVTSACYSPHAQPGSPCDPGPCPSELLCSPITHTCEVPGDAMPRDSARADSPPAGWLMGYTHRKRIMITPIAAPTTLLDFPVSISTSADVDLANTARSDGSDIVFTAADGTSVLPSELVGYMPLTGAIDAWARTGLPLAAPSVLYMYFGGASLARTSPWSSLFAGVWHMSGSAALATDSARGHDVSNATAVQQPALVGGLVGTARNFDGVDDILSAPDPADGSLDFGTSSFSFSVWVNVKASAGPYDIPLCKGGGSATTTGYDFELGTGAWNSGLSDGTANIVGGFGTEAQHLGAWTQLTSVVDRTAQKFYTYVNGVLRQTNALTVLSVSNMSALSMSRLPDVFKGQLDEVRIYTDALSASWIATEYQNLNLRSQFMTVAAVETH